MFFLLLFIWFVFNGKVTFEITWIGVLVCMLVYLFMCRFMDYSVKKDVLLLKKSVFFLYYIGVLAVEIVKANVQIAKLILSDREIVEPIIIKYRTSLKTQLGRTILANSITLTPGTFTVSMEENELVIHCLDASLSEDMDDLKFERLLKKLERGE